MLLQFRLVARAQNTASKEEGVGRGVGGPCTALDHPPPWTAVPASPGENDHEFHGIVADHGGAWVKHACDELVIIDHSAACECRPATMKDYVMLVRSIPCPGRISPLRVACLDIDSIGL